jgi:GDP-L-fucose synthase
MKNDSAFRPPPSAFSSSAFRIPPSTLLLGHTGMVGSALLRNLSAAGYEEIFTASYPDYDLRKQATVEELFKDRGIEQVYLAAARVGGILANNSYPADFIYDNLLIQANVIEAAFRAGVRKLLFLGSSCIYPKLAEQPMREEALLTGYLEPTNEPYAIAKIAGIKLCESYNRQHGTDYRSVMPTNLFGPGDNFDLQSSHVIPALMRKFHEAKVSGASEVEVWGSGSPRREFLHVNDLAGACRFVMELPAEEYWGVAEERCSHLNVGRGTDLSIAELAELMKEVVGFEGEIGYDSSKPDGAPRKLLDVSRLKALGWEAGIGLKEGLESTYAWAQGSVFYR